MKSLDTPSDILQYRKEIASRQYNFEKCILQRMILDTLDTLQEIDREQKPFKKVFKSQNPLRILAKLKSWKIFEL